MIGGWRGGGVRRRHLDISATFDQMTLWIDPGLSLVEARHLRVMTDTRQAVDGLESKTAAPPMIASLAPWSRAGRVSLTC